jgi:hypothetical protein
MGWWSTTIMGGDSPLDFEDAFYGICQFEKWDDSKQVPIPAEVLMSHLPQILDRIEENRDWKWELQIGYQVLGVMLMKAGCEISPGLKGKIIQSALEDEWAQGDGERMRHCQKFAKQIQSYEGSPTKVDQEGLFEVFLKHKETGGSGLINKIP